MPLKPITSRNESEKAFALFKEKFTRDAQVFPGHRVGFQGGGHRCDVYWHGRLGVWGLFEPSIAKGRYWICYGLENPVDSPMLTITVETNPPIEGVNRRCAGTFLKDDQGDLYIAHSGRVGGGRKGIGKKAFRIYAQNKTWNEVIWPNGNRSEVMVICRLDLPDLPARTAEFVHQVARFKVSVVSDTQTPTDRGIRPKEKPDIHFGKRDPQITGNTGLYFCCYQLSQRGWNVMPTARNARGVDIIAYTPDASKFVGIQVKTLSRRSAVPLGKNLDKVMGDFWIIVNRMAEDPCPFIMRPSEVKELASQAGTGDKTSFWLEPKNYEKDSFREAWERIQPSG